jgi:hypothetical protein
MSYLNRSKHLVFIRLNTGETIHLAPNEVSRALQVYEVDRSPHLAKLLSAGIIAVAAERSGATGAPAPHE